MAKSIVLYYSKSGQNLVNNNITELKKGNVEIMADFIQEATGSDIFKVETKEEYPEEYYKLMEVTKQEAASNARPEVKEYIPSLDEYDTIFLCYPLWWNTLPMVMFTFLTHYNLAGKKIVCFSSNEGGGVGYSVRELKDICLGANVVKPGYGIVGSQTVALKEQIQAWAKHNL